MSCDRLRTASALVLVLLLALVLVPLLPLPLQAQHFPADEDLELMLRYIVEDAGAPGIVLGVLEADGSSRVVSWGSGGVDTRALSPRSVFELGSITKTFTATVLADMVVRGEVALDDPVQRYLPDHVTVPSRGGRTITLEQLATHTSGLPMWGSNPARRDRQEALDDYDVEAMYAFLDGLEPERDPGSGYGYSNLGFGLLGHALARAAGTTWQELVRQRVLDPLGMGMTGYRPQGGMDAWMTRGHEPGGVVSADTEARWGSAGILSTAHDMLLWVDANLRPPEGTLGQAMRLAHRPRIPGGEGGSEVGLGWQTLRVGDRAVVWHGGRRAGYMARIGFDPQRRIGTVLLTNTEAFTDSDLASALLLMAPVPEAWQAREDPRTDPATLQEYAGEYRGSSGGSFYIRLEDEGWLTYQPSGKARTRLYPRSASAFYMLRGPWTLSFRKDDAGEVAEMTMVVDEREPAQEGVERTLRKVSVDTPPPEVIAAGRTTDEEDDMGSTLQMVGFWRWPLVVCFGLVVALGLWSAARLFRSGGSPDPRTRVWVDATLFWGLFALVCGALGSVMGVIRAFQGFETAGTFMSPLVAPGVVMATVTPLLGLSVLAVAALLWFFLQLRWRLLAIERA